MGNKEPKPQQPVQSQEDKMFETMFEFKQMASNYRRESEKAAKNEKAYIKKVKDAIEKNDPEGAKIFAQDAIRNKNDITRFKVLSSKLTAVSSRLEQAYKTQQLTGNMQKMCGILQSSLSTQDLVKVCFSF